MILTDLSVDMPVISNYWPLITLP